MAAGIGDAVTEGEGAAVVFSVADVAGEKTDGDGVEREGAMAGQGGVLDFHDFYMLGRDVF